jgi:O-antigen/teichoic acid export membrane protein
LLVGSALLAFVFGGGIALLFPLVFDIAADVSRDVQLAIVMMSLGYSVYFVGAVPLALLWGYERLDLVNACDVPITILRLVVMIMVVRPDTPLSVLGEITLAGNLLAAILYAATALRLDRNVLPDLKMVSLESAKDITSLGLTFFALNASRSVTAQLGPLIIGHVLGPADVAIFAIARQISTYCNVFIQAVTQLVAARAVVLQASGDHLGLKLLFVRAGRYVSALSLYVACGLVVLGSSFLFLWQGGRHGEAYLIAVVLMAGEIIPMSQWVTYWMLTSTGRQGVFTIIAVAEGLLMAISIPIAASFFGLVGGAAAVAASGFVTRGIAHWIIGCRKIGLRPLRYLGDIYAPLVLAAFALGLAAPHLRLLWGATSWLAFVVSFLGYTLLFAIVYCIIVLGPPVLAKYLVGRPGRFGFARFLGEGDRER